MSEFSDRIVFITGASGGLGEDVTKAFLESGATVVGFARSWAKGGFGRGFIGVEADLTTAEGCKSAVTAAVNRAGVPYGVLHLMGGFAGGKPVHQTDDETWNRMMGMNLNSAFYTIRAVLPHLIERRGGRIIAVGSKAGAEPGANLSAYSASKAALHALIQVTAAETRNLGITVNAVLPSIIDTQANRAAMPSADFTKWVAPASIASLLLWLASDAAADVTGALIPIYGRA